jgi:sodium-dependent phosphate cotransporter
MQSNLHINTPQPKYNYITKPLQLLIVFFGFFISIELMGGAFKMLNEELALSFINATANPFISLFIGLLATAIMQSSSATTSMIVAIVASGAISFENAVPMVMGANIGTTVTSTIVSLGHITRRSEFRKAFSAGTAHDFFNILVTIILFPLEYYFGLLSRLIGAITDALNLYSGSTNNYSYNILEHTIRPFANYILSLADGIYLFAVVLFSVALLFYSIQGLSNLVKKMIIGESQKKFEKYLFGNPAKSLFWGTVLTAAMQSSSIVTSVVVPLVATGKVSLRKSFPFIIGANIGTTFTAMIAAAYRSEAAVSIALAHVLFNVIGALLFMPIPSIRNIPVTLASFLGNATTRSRMVGFGYLLAIFFLIPFLLIYFTENKPLLNKHSEKEKKKEKTELFIRSDPQRS